MTTIRIYSIMKPTTTYLRDVGGQAPWGPAQCWLRVAMWKYADLLACGPPTGCGPDLSISKCEKWTHTMRVLWRADFNVIWSNSYED